MNKKQEYQLRLAKTSFGKGEIFGAFNALMKASWYGLTERDVKKIKTPKLETIITAPTQEEKVEKVSAPTIFTKRPNDVDEKLLRASIYNWAVKPTISTIPFGYVDTNVISVDFSRGDILIVNDILRKNINTLFAGITRADNMYLVGANDPLNSLIKWEKHFAFIGRTEQETSAVISSVFFTLQERKEEPVTNEDLSVFLYVNNLHTLKGIDAQRVKSILEAPKHLKVNVIGNVDKKNFQKVKAMFGDSFEYVITFDFTSTSIVSSSYTGDVSSYVIPNEEIDAFDRNSNSYFNPELLNVPRFILYNTVADMKNNGVVISDKVSSYIFGSGDYYSEIYGLSFEEVEEFMKFVMNDNTLAASLNDVVPDLSELLVIADDILSAGKPLPNVPNVIVEEFEVDLEPSEPVRAYSKTELDKIFEDSVRSGLWQQVAKSNKISLTDEQMETIENIIGVKSVVPRVIVEDEPTVTEEEYVEEGIVTEPAGDVEIPEATIKTYMITTGESREATIKFLKENLSK